MGEAVEVPPAASAHDSMIIMGPYVIGWQVGIIVSVVALTMFRDYMRSERFKRDSREVKVTVWSTVILTLSIVFLYCWCELAWAIEPRRDEDTLFSLKGTDWAVLNPCLVQAAVVQSFLAHRATMLIRRKMLRWAASVILALLIIATIVSTSLFIGSYYLWWKDSDIEPPWGWNTGARLLLAFTATTDVAIAITFASTLRSKVAGFNTRTDLVLQTLSMVSLQTGGLTAIVALSGAIASVIAPIESLYSDVSSSFVLTLPGWYALSLITNLNARSKIAALPGGPLLGGTGANKEFSIGRQTIKEESSAGERGLSVLVETPDSGRSRI